MLKEILQSRWFTLAAVTVMGLVAISLFKIVPLAEVALHEKQNLEQKIIELKQENQQAQGFADYLKSDAYLERQARIKLNYKKPDESVIFVYKKPAEQTASQSLQTLKGEDIIAKVKNWFSNMFNK